ncbi:hypothetical protein MYRA21_0072 [Myroides sp. A21]|uniref:DUF6046 domain-containing protein n=1 Tax=Myroides sp. A21 TaxID=1583100 RepID=UPI00057DE46F|nr:DUF6046 domain-containing protein [Myroides sp. A21]AJA67316.1 hypothetical protein MYRA21_0072 [Myroides sp. A21]
MDARFGVAPLLKAAFGVNTPIFIPWAFQKKLPPKLKFDDVEFNIIEESDRKSWMGTPIMFSGSFLGENYNVYDKKTGELEKVSMSNFDLPAATVFQFRRAKNLVRTNVSGANGTVKELYGFDDWVIDVKGLILDEPNQTAKEQLEELIKWQELADSISVSGDLFETLNIERVCINEFEFNIPQGTPGVIAYTMTMLSDDPLEF